MSGSSISSNGNGLNKNAVRYAAAHDNMSNGAPDVVLVADDFAGLRKITCQMLEHHGFNVIEAENGREAVEKAISDHPDIVLMDIAMPEMNGIEATRAIHEHGELSHLPIIAVTSYGKDIQDGAIDAGCIAAVQKPVHIKDLLPLLHKCLDHDRYSHASASH